MNKRKILVTSALPYANGSIHLGHLVEYIQTDIWVRFRKCKSTRSIMCCADDTHGTPIMLRAEQEGITPRQLIDRVWHEHKADLMVSRLVSTTITLPIRLENQAFCEDIYRQLEGKGI